MKGRLNVFQRTMLLWNDLSPYNAVHVVKITQPLMLEKLQFIVNETLERLGLTGFVICRRKKRFSYEGGPANIEIKIIHGSEEPFAHLTQAVEEELNQSFLTEPKINPFRFFVVTADHYFYFGLTYFHVIAGVDSIIVLLRKIVSSYLGQEVSETLKPLKLYPKSYRYHLLRHIPSFLWWFYYFPDHIVDIRASFRPRFSDMKEHHLGFIGFSVPPAQFHTFSSKAKSWGVTLNDMFLAVLLKSLAPLAQDRIKQTRRKKLSVASIVNIRKDLFFDQPEVFGLFLSSFSVSHLVPDGIRLEDLARDVHRETRKIKAHKLYLGSLIELVLALKLIPSFGDSKRTKFYPKKFPLWGGLTNIDLKTQWKESKDLPVDYFRAVSAGPALPLVFSVTTVKDTFNIGVSFNKDVFGRKSTEKIISDFSNMIS